MRKITFVYLLCSIFLLPLGIKAQSIYQIYHRTVADFFDYLVNPAVGLFVAPAVYIPYSGLVKGCKIRLGIKIFLQNSHIAVRNAESFRLSSEPCGVGSFNGKTVFRAAEKLLYFFKLKHYLGAYRRLNLTARFALRTLIQHYQKLHKGKR